MRLDPLELPSGGTITFRDDEEVRAGDYRRMRARIEMNMGAVQTMAAVWPTVAAALIDDFKVPYDVSGVTADGLDELRLSDARALEHHLVPWVIENLMKDPELGKSSAPALGSERGNSSAVTQGSVSRKPRKTGSGS